MHKTIKNRNDLWKIQTLMAYVQLSGYTACKVLLTASSEVKVSSPADNELNVHHDVKKNVLSVHSAI